MPALDELAGDPAAHYIFLYTREAHPGELRGHHVSFEDKCEAATRARETWQIKRPIFIDDLEGTVHRAYGSLPNMTYVIDRRGRIRFRSNWTDATSVAAVVAALENERMAKERGVRQVTYYAEWAPMRAMDGVAFTRLLLDWAGERAVEEFAAARLATNGEGAARLFARALAAARELSPEPTLGDGHGHSGGLEGSVEGQHDGGGGS